jgi:hypothetical protein
MDVRPQVGHHSGGHHGRADHPANQRPPLFLVASGSTFKCTKVELLGTPDDKPLEALKPSEKVWVREYSGYLRPGQTAREATIAWRNLQRAFRSKQEEELGRDFTTDEETEYNRLIRLRLAQHRVEHSQTEILNSIEAMAQPLGRATEDLRRTAASDYRLVQKVDYTQHDLPRSSRTLVLTSWSRRLVVWLQMDAEIKRLGGAIEEAES